MADVRMVCGLGDSPLFFLSVSSLLLSTQRDPGPASQTHRTVIIGGIWQCGPPAPGLWSNFSSGRIATLKQHKALFSFTETFYLRICTPVAAVTVDVGV